MNEKEIIKRCQNGDKSAFDELIRAFYPYVTKYLLKLTHDESLTEDLTQEVFIKIIRVIDEYRINGKASFATYVITTAKNCYIDYIRKNKAFLEDIPDETPGADNVEKTVITNMQYSTKMRARRSKVGTATPCRALKSLPPRRRILKIYL